MREHPIRSAAAQTSAELLTPAQSLAVAVAGRYSSTHCINDLLSLGGKSEQLPDCSSRIFRPRLPDCWRVPNHLEHRGIFGRSDSSRLSRYIPGNGHCRRKALSRGRIKGHPQSTDYLQLCLQGFNQHQKIAPGNSLWRVAVLVDSATNSAKVSLRSVQARPEGDHGELVGSSLLCLPFLALTPS